MVMTTKYKQQLKAQAHKLKPIVLMGNQGLTPAVMKEIDLALDDHELLKIRIQGEDRDSRHEMAQKISIAVRAELVQLIGRIGVFYRKKQ